MKRCTRHNFQRGFCVDCLWPERDGPDIERSREALTVVDELMDTRGMSEADAVRIAHQGLRDVSLRCDKAGRDGKVFTDR
jgi:hypothetical protein